MFIVVSIHYKSPLFHKESNHIHCKYVHLKGNWYQKVQRLPHLLEPSTFYVVNGHFSRWSTDLLTAVSYLFFKVQLMAHWGFRMRFYIFVYLKGLQSYGWSKFEAQYLYKQRRHYNFDNLQLYSPLRYKNIHYPILKPQYVFELDSAL